VVDRTGLTGAFDFELTFAPQPGVGSADPAAGAVERAPSVFVALQDQLGLKLEARKAPVDVLVVDRIERPTPD
jgi:uncharacterized protein (TIGR03435 family)